jgi:tripartite-type tricarboxylate transporter receptor subunit TctC
MPISKRAFVLFSLGLFSSHIALAQSPATKADPAYPSRSVRIVVAFAPGGGGDILGRIISKRLTETLGQSFVVENKTGAAGNIAAEEVARSTADGYTLLVTTASIAVNVSLYPKLGYDLRKDLVGVTQLASVPLALVVSKNVPAKNLAEFIEFARKNKAGLNSASNGSGTTSHLASVLFAQRANVPLVNIPYKGSAPAVASLMSGETDLGFTSILSAHSAITSGKAKALAVTTKKPSPQLPGVPTVATVLPGFEIDQWYGLFAPAKTPAPILARLQQEVSKALTAAEVKEYLNREGASPVANTPEQFAKVLDTEINKYAELVKATGLQVE